MRGGDESTLVKQTQNDTRGGNHEESLSASLVDEE